MKATLIALLGAAAAIAASTIGASAQVLNLSGQFQCVLDASPRRWRRLS